MANATVFGDRMDNVEPEHFLLDQVPSAQRALIPGTLKTAYDAAALLASSEPILQVPSAADNFGRLKSWAVDLAFIKLIESGRWPFDYRWCRFAKPTGRYLEIRLSHSRLTISLVKDPAKQPRNVLFRENARLSNQAFLDLPEFADERAVAGLPTFLLVHGHKDLQFAHLGIPNKKHALGYIYRTPNLMKSLHEVAPQPEIPSPEQTDFEAAMSLKEEIERWRKDNNDE